MDPPQGKSLLSWPLGEKDAMSKWLRIGGVQAEGTALSEDLEAGENMEYVGKTRWKDKFV